MKHAYLIIAHSGWELLRKLVSLLDDAENDIYIHIDKKIKEPPIDSILSVVKKSKIFVFQKYKVYWGSFELVQTELFLFKQASENEYDYYHLLSGADLPIKPLSDIKDFFVNNAGYEFVHFDSELRLTEDKEILRRTRLYHFLQNYRRRYRNQLLNTFFTTIERSLLGLQLIFGIDRMRNRKDLVIKYGSQWVSITHELVTYLLEKESLIYDVFQYTNCADELFIQTLVYNSNFKDRLYNKKYDDSVTSNMRLIDIKKRGKNGNPYIWKIENFNEINDSICLWARKFSYDVDKEIIDKVYTECCRIKQTQITD